MLILYAKIICVLSIKSCRFVLLSYAEVSREDDGDWYVEIKNEVGTLTVPFKCKVKGESSCDAKYSLAIGCKLLDFAMLLKDTQLRRINSNKAIWLI